MRGVLHLWKNYCNRVKKHPITLSPDSVEDAVNGEDLEALLGLEAALTENPPVGKMRDSSALQLFSLENCVKCLSKRGDEK
jgi:hypothetical protein